MFKNYLKIAFRNLLKNKVFSLINISGLTIGIATTIMIGLWINDEFSYNDYFENKENIAQVYQHGTLNGKISTSSGVSIPLANELRENYSDNFKYFVTSSYKFSNYLKNGDANVSFEGYHMEKDAPFLLNLEIIAGAKDGLKDPNSIMISESTAKTLFKNEDPIGKSIKMDNLYDLFVTGVYKDIPDNNSFSDADFLGTLDSYENMNVWVQFAKDRWSNNNFQLYVQVNENITMEAVSEKIRDVRKKHERKEFNPEAFLHPMKNWYLRSDFQDGVIVGGRIENIWLFGIIGAFVLLLACINFVNLSTARSEKRSMEVGIRKSIGSNRGQLITQFLSESLVIVFLSFLASLCLVLLFMNGFNNLASKSIIFPWSSILFWVISLIFITIISILAGSYPALYLSSFKPVAVIKGTFNTGKNSSLPRKILVVVQFTVSIALIIGTLTVMSQINHAKNRPVGYDRGGLIQIPTLGPDFNGKSDLMRNQFIASGAAIEMGTSSESITDLYSVSVDFDWEGKPDDLQINIGYTWISYEYVEALGVKVIEGRDFSRDFASDSTAVILNKAAVEYMGIKDPVGKFITLTGSRTTPKPRKKIIGVIDDMIMESPYNPVKQTMYVFSGGNTNSYCLLRLNPDRSVRDNLATIERVFKANFPNLPYTYQFVDREYASKFRAEERIASLSSVFTLLVILISCLGLFGLVSFVAEQRTKEIGVRKTLGASVRQLWMLLSKNFIKLVVISLLLASPIAYYMMSEWLQKFTYRIELTWMIFAAAYAGALVITIITVSFQTIRSARANPVDSLRTE